MLEFFAQEPAKGANGAGALRVLRPLSNSNLVLDFHRYMDASYFPVFTQSPFFAAKMHSAQTMRLGSLVYLVDICSKMFNYYDAQVFVVV